MSEAMKIYCLTYTIIYDAFCNDIRQMISRARPKELNAIQHSCIGIPTKCPGLGLRERRLRSLVLKDHYHAEMFRCLYCVSHSE